MSRIALLLAFLAAPALGQEQEAHRELLRRQQQSDAFAQQIRQTIELQRAAPAQRREMQSRHADERRQLENVSERQQREVKPQTPPEQRAVERARAAEERRGIIAP